MLTNPFADYLNRHEITVVIETVILTINTSLLLILFF